MVIFLRVLATEALKVKRTLALWMVLVAPSAIVLLSFLIMFFGAERLARGGGDQWRQLTSNTTGLWTLLMMPMFVTLETSLLAGLEHAEKNWKSLLALPAPRWTIYAAKLLVMIAMLWAAHLVLFGLTYGSAFVLRATRPVLGLDALPLLPFAGLLVRISGAALFGLAIQHWVSLRWQSFPAALGFGMCAMILGFVAANSPEWGRWVPWSMPIFTSGVSRAAGVINPLPVALAGAAVVAVLGAWHFSRREIA